MSPPAANAPRPLGDLSVQSTQWLADAVLRSSSSDAPPTAVTERSSIAKPKVLAPKRAPRRADATALLPCPRCREGTLITGGRGWGCSRWREGCRFVVWFDTAGRRLSPAQLRDLITRGKTRKAMFVDAGGASVEARLVLDVAIDGGVRLESSKR